MSMQWIRHHRKLHKRHLKHRWQWQVSLTWTQKRAEELDFMPEFLPSKNIHLSLSRGWANLIQQFTETHCVSMYRALISMIPILLWMTWHLQSICRTKHRMPGWENTLPVWNLIELTGLGNGWMVKTPVDLTYDGPIMGIPWNIMYHPCTYTADTPLNPVCSLFNVVFGHGSWLVSSKDHC